MGYFDSIMSSLDAPTLFFWAGIPTIILLAAVACGLIIAVTRWNIRSMMNAASDILNRSSAAPQSAEITTVGVGKVVWKQGGRRVTISRRSNLAVIGGGIVSEDADEWIATLIEKLSHHGFDERDIVEEDLETMPHGHLVQSAVLTIRDPMMIQDVLDNARSAGFIQDQGAAAEEITPEDALQTAGERAMKDALDSIHPIAEALSIAPEKLAVVGTELETSAAPAADSTEVAKRATLHWRTQTA